MSTVEEPAVVAGRTLSVDGRTERVDIAAGESLLDVLRDRCGRTGTKSSCRTGACGACAVLLDGAPVASCVVPADAVGERAIATVEGVAAEGPHPVQRALLARDAIQCGYCTPGFVMTAVAFHDRWRATASGPPPESDVRAALAGNVCRCGCHPRIVAAVRDACAGLFDTPARAARPETEAKVTGAARYTTDVRLPGQLVGVLVGAAHPHAVVRSVDDRAALAVPGVHAVVRLVADGEVVRYRGAAVAAVAASSRAAARAGAAALRIDYEPRPFAVASDPAEPEVYSAKDRRSAPSAGEVPTLVSRWRWDGNVRSPRPRPFGRAARQARAARRAFAGAGPEIAATYTTEGQTHAPLEPHACVASWHENGLDVYLSTQALSLSATLIARRWKLPRERVRVVAEHVGGAFGAKQSLTAEAEAAIELSRATGRPVQVVVDHDAELSTGGHRPPGSVRVRLKLTPDGGLAALSVRARAATGVAVGSDIAKVAGLLYPGAPRELIDESVVSHTPPGTPFRASSGPPAIWALEQAVDEAALLLGEDPLALRARWDPAGAALYEWARSSTPWPERTKWTVADGRIRRALGLATASWFYYLQPRTRVRLSVGDDGLTVAVAVAEVGTGVRALLATTVAEAFGVPPSEVRTRTGDTTSVPGPIVAGSSVTASLAPALDDAVARLRVALARQREDLTGAVPVADGVRHAGGLLPWPEVLRSAGPVAVTGTRPRDAGRRPRPWYSPMFGAGRGCPSVLQVSEVEVDTATGAVRVPRVWCGLSVGRIRQEGPATAQCHGAVIQALGQTLFERRRVDERTGAVVSTSLDDYELPGLADVPDIRVSFLPGGFEHAAHGGAGLAEVAGLATTASVGNAVAAALGRRCHALPLTPDVILEECR